MCRWAIVLIALAAAFLPLHAGAATFTVDSTEDEIDADPGDGTCASAGGACTLRAAIMESNALAGADSITLPEGVYRLTLGGIDEDDSATGDLDLSSEIAIVGSGVATCVVDGDDVDRVLDVQPGGTATLSQLAIIDGFPGGTNAAYMGGCVRNRGTVTLRDAEISECVAGSGGGVYNDVAAVAELTRVVLHHNQAVASGGSGGAVLNSLGTMVLSDVTARQNQAGRGGGISTAVIEPDSSFTATDLTLTLNTSTGHGGGIYAGGTAHLMGVVISDNHSNQAGGGFWGAATITNFTVTGNTAGWYGGGLNLTGNGILTATNGLIEDNDGADQGGGISNQQWGTVVLTDVTVRNNVAAHGAGIHNGYGSSIEMQGVTISGNVASYGAGFNNEGYSGGGADATATLVNVTISGNTAEGLFAGGGGIYNAYGSTELTNVTIVGNAAAQGFGCGPGIKNETAPGDVFVTNSIIAHNHWYHGGGTEDDCGGVVTSTGYNISSHACFNPPHATDRIVDDAGVEPLADNGGPTETRALSDTSPAVDAADPGSFPATDQRGVPRPFGPRADVGAFELDPGTVPLFSDGFESGDTSAWSGPAPRSIPVIRMARVTGPSHISSSSFR